VYPGANHPNSGEGGDSYYPTPRPYVQIFVLHEFPVRGCVMRSALQGGLSNVLRITDVHTPVVKTCVKEEISS